MLMQNMDRQVIMQSLDWVATETLWFCTVLRTYGSAPRAPGALMTIKASGQYCGSLSGGCVEEDFIARIRAGDFMQSSQIVRYGDGGLTPNRELPCGGILDILIERLPATPDSFAYLTRLAEALAGYQSLRKEIRPPFPCHYLEECDYSSSATVCFIDDRISLTIAAAPRLIIAGLSAVALCCAEFAVALGFETILCEPRPEVLDNFASQLPYSVILKKVFPARYLEEQDCHANTAIVALTHDPRMDDLTMMEAVNTAAFYLGAMGSVRNSQSRLNRLRERGGLTELDLRRIHAPIGIDIGSKTPAEIALAVMADIVRQKNSRVSQ
jgi:xanthine dehydrogenase accessory factor